MDQMTPDEVLEVPDTPDALVKETVTARSGLEKQGGTFRSAHLGKCNLFPDESKNPLRRCDKAHIHPPISSNKSFRSGHHVNSSGFHSGDSSSSGNSLIFRRKVSDKGLNNETKGPEHVFNTQNSKSSFTSQSHAGKDKGVIDLTERKRYAPETIKVFPSGAPVVARAELTDSTASCGRANSTLILKEATEGRHLSDATKVDSSLDRVVNNNDAQLNSQKSESIILNSSPIPRPIRQIRLVRNGCISPMNVAKGKQPVQKECSSSEDTRQSDSDIVASSNAATSSIDVRDIVAEGHNSHSWKGKGVLNHLCSTNTTNSHKSIRSSLSINEKAGECGGTSNGGVPPFEESNGWRSTRSQSRKLNPPVSHQGQHITVEDSGPCSTSQSNGKSVIRIGKDGSARLVHKNSNGQTSESSTPLGKTKGGHMTKSTVSKRQKLESSSTSKAECSRSANDDSDIMFVDSSEQTTRAISTEDKHHNGVSSMESVIHIDETTPEVHRVRSSNIRRSPGNADATAAQVELDEILARELQEQFYNEDPAVGSGEIDAHIALAVQQEEESQHAVPRRRQPANTSNSGRSHTNRPRAGTRASSSNRMARLRSRFPGQPRTVSSSRGRNSTNLSSRQRNSLFPADMDIDMRLHILETLESISEMGAGSSFLQTQRDFNENDYEMLLALDENNHQHGGATTRQINGLPQSTVQCETLEEACAICLDNPTMGDVICHLPCLHKFHKDCIDPWLTRRTSCPVCKSSIT